MFDLFTRCIACTLIDTLAIKKVMTNEHIYIVSCISIMNMWRRQSGLLKCVKQQGNQQLALCVLDQRGICMVSQQAIVQSDWLKQVFFLMGIITQHNYHNFSSTLYIWAVHYLRP